MDKLIFSRYGLCNIELDDRTFFTLSIENCNLLLQILAELKSQSNGGQGDFSLLLKDRALCIDKSVFIITDFTDIDFNSKVISNLILKKFNEFVAMGQQLQALSSIETILLNLGDDFKNSTGLNLECETALTGGNLTKVCSFRIANNTSTLLEKLCEYVNILTDLKPLKVLILAFGKAFLKIDQIVSLQRYCIDKGVRLMLILGKDDSAVQECERRIVIDSDLCAIPMRCDIE